MSHTSSNKNEQCIFFSKLHFVFWILLCNVNKVKSKERNKCFLAPYYDLSLVSSTTSLGQIDINEEDQVHIQVHGEKILKCLILFILL